MIDEIDEPNDEEKEIEAEFGPEQADDDGPEEDESEGSEERLHDDDEGPEPTVPPGIIDAPAD